MELNDIRSLATVFFFVFFLGTVWWVFRRGSGKLYEDAARMPLNEDDEQHVSSGRQVSRDQLERT